jgi:hypothetical protein
MVRSKQMAFIIQPDPSDDKYIGDSVVAVFGAPPRAG